MNQHKLILKLIDDICDFNNISESKLYNLLYNYKKNCIILFYDYNKNISEYLNNYEIIKLNSVYNEYKNTDDYNKWISIIFDNKIVTHKKKSLKTMFNRWRAKCF